MPEHRALQKMYSLHMIFTLSCDKVFNLKSFLTTIAAHLCGLQNNCPRFLSIVIKSTCEGKSLFQLIVTVHHDGKSEQELKAGN